MTYTLIDSDNYAASGIETMFFPGGEPHVKVPLFEGNVLFVARCRTWEDTTFAALVCNAVSRQVGINRFSCFMPYLPAARQDKYDGRSAKTLEVVGAMFNSSHARLFSFDMHSDTAALLYHGLRVNFLHAGLDFPGLRGKRSVVGIIAPDEGALERAEHFRRHVFPNAELVRAKKERDSQTGRLSNYVLPPLPRAGHYIVVDDICDGGGTFNLLAHAFALQTGVLHSLELFVSHGIFSKGLDAISPVYKHITTTDSWCRLPSSERLTVLPLAPLYPRCF